VISEQQVTNRLVDYGERLWQAPEKGLRDGPTDNEAANRLLNDIENHPHAFVLACIMDQQVKYQRAWLIPYHFQKELGDFSMQTLNQQSEGEIRRIMGEGPKKLHRFTDNMSKYFYEAVARIRGEYEGDASRIWANRPPSATVIYRFLEFDGVGPKIASMATNILARELKVEFSDYYSIDVSADVHVRRVFRRLGLTPEHATVEQVIFRARSLHPEFPGVMDIAAWEIGKGSCYPREPLCDDCMMADVCPRLL